MPAMTLESLSREVERLRADIIDARRETRSNAASVARVIRQSRLEIVRNETERAMDRLRPDLSVVEWTPRGSEAARPDLAQSLIDRLRKGDPVSTSMGNADPFAGVGNQLADPLFDGVATNLPYIENAEATKQVIGEGYDYNNSWIDSWYAFRSYGVDHHLSVYGTDRSDQWAGPYASGTITITHSGVTSPAPAEHDQLVIESAVIQGPAGGPYWPFKVASCRIIGTTIPTGLEATFSVELWAQNPRIAAYAVWTRVAYQTVDLREIQDRVHRLYCAKPYSAAEGYPGYGDETTQWKVRFVYDATSDGTAGVYVRFPLGEAQLHWALTADPISFTPQVAMWWPNVLASFGRWDYDTLIMTIPYNLMPPTGTDSESPAFSVNMIGDIGWGPTTRPSSGADVTLKRDAIGRLSVQSFGSLDLNDIVLKVRATATYRNALSLIKQGDTYGRAELEGSSAGEIALRFGPGTAAQDVRFRRSGAKAAQLDDNAGGALALDLVGTLTADGIGADTMQRAGVNLVDTTETTAINANARLAMGLGGTLVGTRRNLNFIAGTHVSLTLTDQPSTDTVDAQIDVTWPSAATPVALSSRANVEGVSNFVSRADHQHAGLILVTDGADGDAVTGIRKSGDSYPRVVLGLDGSGNGALQAGAGSTALDVDLHRAAADVWYMPDKLRVASLRLQTTAGTPVDGDITGGAESGDIVLDTTNSLLYVRVGSTWKSVAVA